jgi:hypothetical protein
LQNSFWEDEFKYEEEGKQEKKNKRKKEKRVDNFTMRPKSRIQTRVKRKKRKEK